MKKILVVFGTRPEAIKMAPLVKALREEKDHLDVSVCVTAQHRDMLDQVLSLFKIIPDYDLDIMTPGQDLYSITEKVLTGVKSVLHASQPDWVLVHGDTTTSFATALAAFYHGSKIGHVEAGLRTYDLSAPFPEEANRQLTTRLANLHFAPTKLCKENLIKENICSENIFITGNTVVDALLYVREKIKNSGKYTSVLNSIHPKLSHKKKIVLITAHRRENFGKPIQDICMAISECAKKLSNVIFVYPVHPNPNIKQIAHSILEGISNVILVRPLNYDQLVCLMDKADIILTDSGGMQEEAPSFGKKTLVLRNVTERQEAVAAGTVDLVGSDKELIVNKVFHYIDAPPHVEENPYGDGMASQKIKEIILQQ